MKKLIILLIVLLSFFAVARSVFAQTATLTATVRVNPLEVKISDSGIVPLKKWFEIPIIISNQGRQEITKTEVRIYSSPKLTVKNKQKKIGNFAPGEKIIVWFAKANKQGDFIIQVEMTGEFAGEQISATDSTLISIPSFPKFSLLRLILGI